MPQRLANLVNRWKSAGVPVAVCVDFDGTLTPIVRRPIRARLSPRVCSLLKALADCPGVEIAVVSGRRLNDVKRLIGLPRLSYVGLHGAERQWRDTPLEFEWEKGDSTRVKRLLRRVIDLVPLSQGWRLDDKGAAAGFHHAGTSPRVKETLRKAVKSACRSLPGPWRLIDNFRTLEVLAAPVDKGRAIRWIRRRMGRGGRLVYLGDDRTDEHAFAALSKKDIGVLVASHARPTRAQFRLVGVKEVHRFLALAGR